jgi:hypothetical protein
MVTILFVCLFAYLYGLLANAWKYRQYQTAILYPIAAILFVCLFYLLGSLTKAWNKYQQHARFILNYKKETLRLYHSLSMTETDIFTEHFSSMHLCGLADVDDQPPSTKEEMSESSSTMSQSLSTVEEEDGGEDVAQRALTLSKMAEKLEGSSREMFLIAHSTALTVKQKVELTFMLQREVERRAAVVKHISGTLSMMSFVSIVIFSFFFCLYSICLII